MTAMNGSNGTSRNGHRNGPVSHRLTMFTGIALWGAVAVFLLLHVEDTLDSEDTTLLWHLVNLAIMAVISGLMAHGAGWLLRQTLGALFTAIEFYEGALVALLAAGGFLALQYLLGVSPESYQHPFVSLLFCFVLAAHFTWCGQFTIIRSVLFCLVTAFAFHMAVDLTARAYAEWEVDLTVAGAIGGGAGALLSFLGYWPIAKGFRHPLPLVLATVVLSGVAAAAFTYTVVGGDPGSSVSFGPWFPVALFLPWQLLFAGAIFRAMNASR